MNESNDSAWPVRHFVITRFNLRESAHGTERMVDCDYLAERLRLFECFCLPTLCGQTRKDFTWLVLLSEDTPQPVRDRVDAWRELPFFKPVWLPVGTRGGARLAVAQMLDESPQILMTTRVDNDDGLARRYVEVVRQYERVGGRAVLHCPVGWVWHRGRVYRSRQRHNAFATLVEPLPAGRASIFTTIYSGSHSQMHQLGRIVELHDEPAWLQVIHDSNIENRVRGRRRPLAEMVPHFDITVPEPDVGNAATSKRDAIRDAAHDALAYARWAAYRLERLLGRG